LPTDCKFGRFNSFSEVHSENPLSEIFIRLGNDMLAKLAHLLNAAKPTVVKDGKFN
jgi:hypothetical protein